MPETNDHAAPAEAHIPSGAVEAANEQPERWAIVSLLGHQERIGRVSGETVAGASMLRIDIPLADGTFSTRHVGGAAIYEITYVDEATARALAGARPAHPLSIWSARSLGIVAPLALQEHDDEDEDDEEPGEEHEEAF